LINIGLVYDSKFIDITLKQFSATAINVEEQPCVPRALAAAAGRNSISDIQ
jgi:hypothetical protein